MADRRFASRGASVCAAAALFVPVFGASAGGGITYSENFESPPFVAGPLNGQGGWLASSRTTLGPFTPATPGFDFGALSMRAGALSGASSFVLARSPLFSPRFGELSMDLVLDHPMGSGASVFNLAPADSLVTGLVFTRLDFAPLSNIRVLQEAGYVDTGYVLVPGVTQRLAIRMASDGVLEVRVDGQTIFTGVTIPFALGTPVSGVDRFVVSDLQLGGGAFNEALVIDNIVFEAEPPACAADLSGDGVVGAADLSALLGSWGPCPAGAPASSQIAPLGDFSADVVRSSGEAMVNHARARIEIGVVGAPPCPADLDGDGVVGAADLSSLLGSWGSCPE